MKQEIEFWRSCIKLLVDPPADPVTTRLPHASFLSKNNSLGLERNIFTNGVASPTAFYYSLLKMRLQILKSQRNESITGILDIIMG